eukprot:763954-Hanusia_phi.AAC.3
MPPDLVNLLSLPLIHPSLAGSMHHLPPSAAFGANAGLAEARKRLEPIKAQFPGLTYADLWILASVKFVCKTTPRSDVLIQIVAIEEMGGPKVIA